MTRPEATTNRAARAAFFLLAAGLVFGLTLATTPAESSLPRASGTDRADLAAPNAAAIDRAPRVALENAPDLAPRLGFAEDACLLAADHARAGFALFERETCRCERTYARNNPLKYVDPDGMLPKDVAWIGNMLDGVARPVKGMALRTWAQVFGAARRGAKHLIFPKGTTKREIADFAGGLHKRGAHVVSEADSKGAHFHIQLPNKEVLKSGEKSEMFVRYGGKPSLHIYIESAVVAGMFVLDRWQSADAEAPEVVPDASDPRFTSYDYTSMWEAREASERHDSDDDESGDGVPRLVRVRDKDGNWSFQMR